MAPEITLDSETGIYTVKVGRALTIAPTVRYAENALFSWTSDGKLLSTEPMLTYTWDEAAEVYVTFTVQNENGKAEEELKVEVLEMAPPVISLALPSKGLKVLQNTDYVFTPDIQNSDLEGFRCEWLREGEVVAEGVTYTFNEAELGTYMVVCRASNVDGEATKEIPVEVVDELPYEVFFPTQSRLPHIDGSLCVYRHADFPRTAVGVFRQSAVRMERGWRDGSRRCGAHVPVYADRSGRTYRPGYGARSETAGRTSYPQHHPR